MNTKLVRRYIELKIEKQKCDARSSEINKEMENLISPIFDSMMDDGITFMKVGEVGFGATSKYWGSGPVVGEKEGKKEHDNSVMYSAFKSDPSTASMVNETINALTLSSYLGELPRDDNDLPILPDHLKGKVDISKKITFTVRGIGKYEPLSD